MNPYTLGGLFEYYRKYLILDDLVNRLWDKCFDSEINTKYLRISRIKEDLMTLCWIFDDQISKCPIDPNFHVFKHFFDMGYWACEEDIRYTIRIAEHPEEAIDDYDRSHAAIHISTFQSVITEQYDSSRKIFAEISYSLQQVLVLNSEDNMSWDTFNEIRNILFDHFMKYHLKILVLPATDSQK